MSLLPAIALAILVMLVFGSSPIVDLVLKKRREKNGDDVIKEPWVQIHEIPGYRDSHHIAAFYPLKGEPNLLPIIEELAREGRLLLPRCEGEGIMNFYKVANLKKDLVPGHFGIMEPREGLEKFEGEIRRFLAKYPGAYKAGIATPAQISKEPLEQKATDIKMDTVIACKPRY